MSGGLEPDLSRENEVFVRCFPLHRACRDGDVAALVSLSEQPPYRAHLTAEDSSFGWTPIHWASHYGQLECVMRLVQMGCEVNAVTSRFNQTPTHTAAFGGHPHCVVWLTQAGADVNRQDFVGEAPIHKAARSGSLECIQVLLIAGAKPHLRNASGQTAADLAQMHGYHDCFRLVSKTQRHHLLQPSGLHGNGVANGNGVLSRKRLLAAAVDNGHMKKARSADYVLVHVQSSGAEEQESMSTESAEEIHSDESPITNGQHPLPSNHESAKSLSSNPSDQLLAAPQRPTSDTCGSLHLSGSPSSCVSHRPTWLGADCGDFLHYGHYHGFGDTAEELCDGSSSCLDNASSVQAERLYKQAVANLYHGS